MRSVYVFCRFAGLAILAILLWQSDRQALIDLLHLADGYLVAIAIGLNLPLVALKAVRWCWLLQGQGISYGIGRATVAYFSSIFLGLLTPGRLGEFVKMLHVSQDCGISTGRAFSSVLADRLCDFYFLSLVGVMAVWSCLSWRTARTWRVS